MIRTIFIVILINFFFVLSAAGQGVKKIKVTDLEKLIKESKTPLIINFWATFCKPCMEEIPHFQKLGKKYEKNGVKLLLVSLDMKDDFPVKVNDFIKKKKITNPVAWLDETNADYFCPRVDKTWSGAIPATLFINNRNSYRKFTEEPLSEEQLEREIRMILGQ
ncbi:MAG TPA: TlpA disulfide reductase family protein [Chitinophagaceae bacterium]|nr:TlpA disulfide reductase family protein [Chitinophagaceae bacterium]